jgi:hypothetical protein
MIYLADDERGNETMHLAARDFAAAHGRPCVVSVYEHAGWRLAWYFDADYPLGIIVGTANDMARFGEQQLRVGRERIDPHTLVYAAAIRRVPRVAHAV